MEETKIKIVECPRDAMQGFHHFIPTETKVEYINALLKVGFHTIDAGSFVSPKSIPQMRDTAEVFNLLDLSKTNSKLLAIVANRRGAEDAVQYDEITYLGYPFSISETFQLRNTNSSIHQSFDLVKELQELCIKNKKQLVIYISMAFGNPYGDDWNSEMVIEWVNKIADLEVKTISLADTVGLATSEAVASIFHQIVPVFNGIEIGAHLHCTPDNWKTKLEAAYLNGCRRFDAAIRGFGGCPMANDELVGNMATENLVRYLEGRNVSHGLNKAMLADCLERSMAVFNTLTTKS